MGVFRHGIRVGIDRVGDQVFVSMQVSGKLTHEDYQVITPLLDNALKDAGDIAALAYIDCSQLEGWEARAAWDDFKLGLHHGRQFGRIAILGSQQWLSVASRVAGWFTSGDVKTFDDETEALEWLLAGVKGA